jgi:hypothetical protein
LGAWAKLWGKAVAGESSPCYRLPSTKSDKQITFLIYKYRPGDRFESQQLLAFLDLTSAKLLYPLPAGSFPDGLPAV